LQVSAPRGPDTVVDFSFLTRLLNLHSQKPDPTSWRVKAPIDVVMRSFEIIAPL